ncbi:amino acid adenylation domain-containing protein [Roseivirga sp. BDSF3-8]|uniref:amino acid adenylation domain-containing protein n=1 Tax=Roseivirga sp. BDSF3-8 TaxID=3241598 RepID=UPI00353241A8
MNPARIISQLAEKGIGISLQDGRLKISGEKGSITPAIQEELRHNKEDIVAFLESRSAYRFRKSIVVVPDSQYHPLSQAQRRMWIMAQMEGAGKIYNLPALWHFKGELDRKALAKSLDQLNERHEVLRTTFKMVEGEPVQQVLSQATNSLEVYEAESIDNARQMAKQAIHQPFDLKNDSLLRVKLYALPSGEHILLLVIHHLVADGLSLNILLDEWLYLYGRELAGKPSELEPLRIQYKDFVHWQQKSLADGGLEADRTFWHERLSGELPVLELPYKDSRPAVQTYNGARQKATFDQNTLQNLQKLSEQEGGSLFMTLLSLVNVLLYKYSGQEDIICGTTISGREHPDLEGQIGLYLNTLALRNQVSGQDSFRSLVSRVSADTLQAFSHSRYPFDQLVEELDIPRDLSRSALFDVLVELQNFASLQMESHGDTSLAGLDIQTLEPESDVARVDLNFVFAEEADGLVLALEYNTDLFSYDQVRRMCLHLQQLAKALSANPEQPVGDYSLVTAEEKEELESFQGSVIPLETDSILPVWQQVVAQYAEKTALHFGDKERYSYKVLDEQTTAIAHWLQAEAGLAPGEIAGMLLPRTPKLLIGILGTWKAGGAYIPMDPAHPLSRLEDIATGSGMKVIVTSREAIDQEVRESLSQHVKLVDWEDIEAGLRAFKGKTLTHTPGPDDLAYVIYTSGSTGKPKGAMVEHKGMLNHLLAKVEDLQMTADSIVAQNATQNFDISVWQMFAALLTGGRTVMIGEDEVLSPAAFLQRIENEKVNILEVVPSYLRVLLDYLENSDACLDVDYLMVTGEELPAALASAWFDRYPDIPLVNAYGPTEASDDITHYFMEQMPEGLSRIPIGHVLRNFRIYVVDKDGKLCPPWVKGELWVSGLGVGKGYLNDEAKTTAAFLDTDPFVTNGERLYRTGDLGRYLPDGRLEFYGRLDNQVKVRGHRIELGEIESRLLKVPGVKQAAVKVWGETDKYLCGYIVGEAPTEDISSQLGKTLPAYMVPQRWVRLDSMPLNSSGKTDRNKLAKPEGEIEREYVAPSTPVEEALAAIWQEVLGVEQIGVMDNFFQLGGHSLRALQTITRIAKKLSVEVTLEAIYKNPDIRQLANYLLPQIGTASTRDILPVSEKEYYLLSNAQKRLWVLSQMQGAEQVYNLPAAWEIQGAPDVGALTSSLNKLVQRHEILRTSFTLQGEQPVQKVHAADQVDIHLPLTYIKEHQVKEKVNELSTVTFNLTEAPLFKATLLQVEESRYVLVLVVQHLISDGLSMRTMLDEWLYLYGRELAGKPSELEPLRIQYKDFVHWQQKSLADGGLEADRTFWHERLSGELPVLELPYKDSRPAVQTYNGARQKATFDQNTLQNLQKLSEQEGGSLFMTLLSLVNVLLYKYSGQEDIICGTTISGREHPDLEGQIGLYLNTLALRNQVSGQDSFRSLVSRVSADTLQAFSHSRYPFDQLVEELDIPRDLSRSALFDVLVELQNFASLQMESHGDTSLAGLDIQTLEPESDVARVDLNFVFAEEADGLVLALEYNTDLFSYDQVRRMCLHLQQLAKALSANPEQPVGDYSLVTAEEKEELESFQGSVIPLETDSILPVWQQVVAQYAEKTALHFGDKERYSYKVLDEQTTAIAHWLQAEAGLAPGEIAGMLLPRTPKLLIGILGTWKAGGAYIPMDPAHPLSRLEDIATGSGMKVIVTSREAIDQEVRESLSQHVKLVDWEDIEAGLRAFKGKTLTHTPGPDDLAYVIYTSGSTGKPKGAMVEHKGMLNHLLAKVEDLQMTADSIVAQNATQNFDISVWQMFAALLTGGRTVMIGEDEVLSPAAFLQRIENEKVNILEVVPSYLRVLLDYLENSDACLDVDYLMVTGEELPAALASAWFDRYPDIPLVNAYGPTEASDDITHYFMEQMPEGLSRIPIGHVLRNFRIYVVDKDGKLCPPWVKGELWVSGLGVGKGYLNDEAKTTAAFLDTDPFVTNGERLYRTGDLGRYLPDGRLEFYGRLDNQVKVRGHRIELGEIESRLLKVPGVKQAAVKVWGETDKYLCGYIVGEAPTEDISSQLGKTLPAYMVPQRWVRLDSMPLNSSGKTDRNKLAKPEGEIEREYVAPSTPVEEALAAIWQEVLGVEQIGVTDNFFQLGGDSIKAILTTSKARLKGYAFDMADIFESGTIRDLSIRVREENTLADQSPVSGEVPLSPVQAAFFAAHTLAPHHYNLSVMLRWPVNLSAEKVQAVFNTLMQHHDALRTVFRGDNGRHKPFIKDIREADAEVHSFDLRNIKETGTKINETSARLQETIDLENGPLLKVGHFQMGNEDRLLVVVHHAVVDGISWRILLEDIQVLIKLAENEEPLKLPPKTESYLKWMESLVQWADSKQVMKGVEWWQDMAGKHASSLPMDMPDGDDKVKDALSESVELDREQTQDLTKVNAVYGTNTSELLLAALSLSLRETFGRQNALVEVETHGREAAAGEMDLSRTVGWFTNFYPVLLEAQDQQGIGYHIKQVKENLRRVPEYGRSYNVLRYMKGKDLPLDAQIGFNYMGHFDDEADEALQIAEDNIGSQVSPEEIRPHAVEISGMIYNGRLTVNIEYGSRRFRQDTILQWAENYRKALETIISESADKKEKEITPSDLGYKDMQLEDLENFFD